MDLFDVISNDIKEAMKAKDKVKLETLRNVKKFFLEATTAPGANDTLTDDAALKIMQKLVKQGKDSAAIYQGQGRADLAEAELAQVAVLEAYLPKQMSNEELEAALKEIIAEVGAAGPQDMGKVMGVATKKLAGKAEGRAISAKVKNYWDNTPAIHIRETKLLPRFIFTGRSFVFYKISEKQTYAVPYPASRLSFSLHQYPGIQSILQCVQPQ